jgi:hypothetical protein
MKSSTKIILLASAAGLLLASCGNPAAKVSTTPDGGTQVQTDQGTFQTGTTIPEDWPKDVVTYPGATVQFSGSNTQAGKPGWALVLLTKDSTADVKSFYEKSLKDNGWSIVADMESQGTIIIGGTKGNYAMSLTAAGQDGQTAITLGVATQK